MKSGFTLYFYHPLGDKSEMIIAELIAFLVAGSPTEKGV